MNDVAVVVSNSNKGVTPYETIDAIKNAGFKNVFIQWYNRDFNPTQEEQYEYIKKQGLNIIFAHLGYQNINDIWLDKIEGEQLVDRYKNDIKTCKERGINLVCMHIVDGNIAPIYNEIGLTRIKAIVDYAKSINVRVCFENTKIKGYVDYIIENIIDENVGLCFDSGHYHAHFKDDLDFKKFKDRIFAIHLHDNNGEFDEHLIPFDGNLDFQKVLNNLKKCNYNGPIILELCYRNQYQKMSIEEFYKKGYEIGKKLGEIYYEN